MLLIWNANQAGVDKKGQSSVVIGGKKEQVDAFPLAAGMFKKGELALKHALLGDSTWEEATQVC